MQGKVIIEIDCSTKHLANGKSRRLSIAVKPEDLSSFLYQFDNTSAKKREIMMEHINDEIAQCLKSRQTASQLLEGL